MAALPHWKEFDKTTNEVTEPDPEPTCSKCGQVITAWGDLSVAVSELAKEMQQFVDEFVAKLTVYEHPRIRKPVPVKHLRTPINKRHRAIRLAGRFR